MVQPKAVKHPTDVRPLRKVLHHLLRVADETGMKLWQSHRDLAKSAFLMHGRYMKANHFKRAAGARRKLMTYAGRVQRDLERKLSDGAWERYKGRLILTELVLTQEKKSKGKVHSLHAPAVECLAKGKAHKPYELGVETSRATMAGVGSGWVRYSCQGPHSMDTHWRGHWSKSRGSTA